VTPTDFYFGDSLGLTRFSRQGGGSSQVLTSNLYPTSIMQVNGEAVWMNGTTSVAQPLSGGPQRTLASPGNPDELLGDPAGQRAYWLDIGTGSTYRVESASLAGGESLSMDTRTTPDLLRQDDSFLYWSVYARLERAPKGLNAGKEPLGDTFPAVIRGLTVTSDAIFVLVDGYSVNQHPFVGGGQSRPAAIHRLSLDGERQAVVACGTSDTFNGTLTAHGGNLYWLGGRGVWTTPIR
jgi:hypothetical protein